jgi:hypothetical protein
MRGNVLMDQPFDLQKPDPADDLDSTWSPDGTRIAFDVGVEGFNRLRKKVE